MTKVCHITTVHEAFDTRIFHKEARSLAKAGYDVTLVAPHKRDETVEGIKIVALPKPKNRFSRIFFTTKEAYRKALEEKADIYHFHDSELLGCGIKLKKKTGAKIIYDAHEDTSKQIISKTWIPKIFRKTISKGFNYYEKGKAKKLDFVIVVTSEIKKSFLRAGIEKIEIIENYPLIDYFLNIKETANEKMKGEEIKLIYSGGIVRVRAIKEIIESLELIKKKKVKLILVGKFQEKGLEEELRRMPGWGKVDFKGWLSQKENYQLMESVDIGLACFYPEPNHLKSVPNKLFEYMSAGLPMVTSDFPLWRNIVEREKCGIFVNPKNPQEIAKAINYLAENPEKATQMGKNGKRAILNQYNWKRESKKLFEIYDNLAKL